MNPRGQRFPEHGNANILSVTGHVLSAKILKAPYTKVITQEGPTQQLLQSLWQLKIAGEINCIQVNYKFTIMIFMSVAAVIVQ